MQEVAGSSPAGSITISFMPQPPDRPLERTLLASASLRAAWEENAADFIAWTREPGLDSYWRLVSSKAVITTVRSRSAARIWSARTTRITSPAAA
jgi:hypothetical protein